MDNFLDIKTTVKKPVEAIQCANTFSLLQRKMYNVLLANAAGHLHPEMTHRIKMKVLCKLMGYRSNDYKTIKQKFRELRRMDIEWDVINENGNKVWTNTSPLSLARVIEGEGICEYEFTPSLIPFLDRPAQYAKFSLAIQSEFQSGYGLALYENCERYRNIGCTKSFDVPTFRKLMGVEESQYLDFFALKRRVIAAAIREVNQHADFNIEAEYQKKGRSIIAIRFVIKNKESVVLQTMAPITTTLIGTDHEDVLIGKLQNYFGLKQKVINKYLNRYDRKYVEDKIEDILNSDSFKKGLIKNMAGYLKTALSEDFQTNISSQVVVAKHEHHSKLALDHERQKAAKLSDQKKSYDYYLSKEIYKLMQTFAKQIKDEMLQGFEEYLGKSIYLDIFHKEGLENILIRDQFAEFTKIKYPEILNTMMSFEAFLKKSSKNDSRKDESCQLK